MVDISFDLDVYFILIDSILTVKFSVISSRAIRIIHFSGEDSIFNITQLCDYHVSYLTPERQQLIK